MKTSNLFADILLFWQAMQVNKAPIFVDCAMNMHVSAFVYLYRRLILKDPESDAYAHTSMTSI